MQTNFKNLFNLDNYEVYIVGGNGLIGTQIVRALEQFGASVTVFDLKIKKKLTEVKLNM